MAFFHQKHVYPLLVCAFTWMPLFLSAQEYWKVVKIRGNIYTSQGYLKTGSMVSSREYVYLTNTSDVMLVRKGEEMRFVHYHDFSAQVSNGKPLKKYRIVIESPVSEYEELSVRGADVGKVSKLVNCEKYNIGYSLDAETCETNEIDIEKSWDRFRIVEKEYVNTLVCDEKLRRGEKLMSANCRYTLILTQEGNVEYRDGSVVLWAPQRIKGGCEYLLMHEDGYLAFVDNKGKVQGGTGINSKSACSYLRLEDDGRLRVLNPQGERIWELKL